MTDAELKAIYRMHTARAAQRRPDCPAGNELVAVVGGAGDRAVRERIADHLIVCSDCAGEFRLLQSLQSQLRGAVDERHMSGEAGTSDVSVSPRSRVRRWMDSLRLPLDVPLAAAASLLLLAGALGAVVWVGWGDRQVAAGLREELAGRERMLADVRRQLGGATARATELEGQVTGLRQGHDALGQPQLNVPIVDLSPRDAFRGAPARAQAPIEVAANAGVVTLILNVVDETPYADYGLEILEGTGHEVWSGRGLQRSPLNTFTVALPRRLVSSSTYRIRLYGLRGAERVLIEDYAVRFQIR